MCEWFTCGQIGTTVPCAGWNTGRGEQGVPVERKEAGEIDALAEGSSHGGVVALVGERRTVDLADLLPAERPACGNVGWRRGSL